MYYLNSRYYNPEIGRYINAKDVREITTSSLKGVNLYTYSVNNPVSVSAYTERVAQVYDTSVAGSAVSNGGAVSGTNIISNHKNLPLINFTEKMMLKDPMPQRSKSYFFGNFKYETGSVTYQTLWYVGNPNAQIEFFHNITTLSMGVTINSPNTSITLVKTITGLGFGYKNGETDYYVSLSSTIYYTSFYTEKDGHYQEYSISNSLLLAPTGFKVIKYGIYALKYLSEHNIPQRPIRVI